MLPFETILAIFPHTRATLRIGRFRKAVLKPLTLAHCSALEVLGCDLDYQIDDSHALIAAWVLSLNPKEIKVISSSGNIHTKSMMRFARKLRDSLSTIKDVVNRHISSSFVTYVPGKSVSSGTTVYSQSKRGFGWPLEIAECLCGAYGWKFDEVMGMPIVRVLALLSIYRNRNGGENGGPDYYERIEIAKLKEMWKKKEEGEVKNGG